MRRFNREQRESLFLNASGKCEKCGRELDRSFHADHVHPHLFGGETDVLNGQALCPTCNLIKGSSMPNAHDRWQSEARRRYFSKNSTDFLLVACPGTGKTRAALGIASELLKDRVVSRIVVVVHTTHLKEQWTNAAAEIGIPLRRNSSGSFGETRDERGMTLTFQGVESNPMVFRKHCGDRPTLVIVDECHHAADQQAWGVALREAFGPAKRRLLLSGTPFRGDSQTIPFVTYEDGRCVPDYNYSYSAAFSEAVVPPIYFPYHEGEQSWSRGGEEYVATFDDDVDEVAEADRLRTSLYSDAGLIQNLARDAISKLGSFRQTGENAGGLVLAMNIEHATRLSALFDNAVIAVSDDPGANDIIKEFRRGNSRHEWLITVRMVSEGVDIPRLRVLMYATNYVGELFFRQAAGRLMRGDPNKAGWMFIPGDSRLTRYAAAMEDERDHVLREDPAERASRNDSDSPGSSDYIRGRSEGELLGVIGEGSDFPKGVWGAASIFHDENRLDCGVPVLAGFLMANQQSAPVVLDAPPLQDQNDRKKDLRSVRHRLISRLVHASDGRMTHKEIGLKLAKLHASADRSTVTELETSIRTLQGWISDVYNNS